MEPEAPRNCFFMLYVNYFASRFLDQFFSRVSFSVAFSMGPDFTLRAQFSDAMFQEPPVTSLTL